MIRALALSVVFQPCNGGNYCKNVTKFVCLACIWYISKGTGSLVDRFQYCFVIVSYIASDSLKHVKSGKSVTVSHNWYPEKAVLSHKTDIRKKRCCFTKLISGKAFNLLSHKTDFQKKCYCLKKLISRKSVTVSQNWYPEKALLSHKTDIQKKRYCLTKQISRKSVTVSLNSVTVSQNWYPEKALLSHITDIQKKRYCLTKPISEKKRYCLTKLISGKSVTVSQNW